jgi:hypothetical protein
MVFEWKMLVHFMAIWDSLRTLGIFYRHLVQFGSFGIISHFGMLYQDKSGNPAHVMTGSGYQREEDGEAEDEEVPRRVEVDELEPVF